MAEAQMEEKKKPEDRLVQINKELEKLAKDLTKPGAKIEVYGPKLERLTKEKEKILKQLKPILKEERKRKLENKGIIRDYLTLYLKEHGNLSLAETKKLVTTILDPKKKVKVDDQKTEVYAQNLRLEIAGMKKQKGELAKLGDDELSETLRLIAAHTSRKGLGSYSSVGEIPEKSESKKTSMAPKTEYIVVLEDKKYDVEVENPQIAGGGLAFAHANEGLRVTAAGASALVPELLERIMTDPSKVHVKSNGVEISPSEFYRILATGYNRESFKGGMGADSGNLTIERVQK